MTEYKESEAIRQLRAQLARHQTGRPGAYDSHWQEALDDVVSQILAREDFSYDPQTDALFQQYQDRYVNLGQRAMMDTLGQTAKLTGGYGNSHAQMASQQAYQTQLQGLYDQIPELYDLAMERYKLQGAGLQSRYDLLSGLDSTDYGRYKDGVAQWQDGRDYLAGQVQAERDFDYTAHRDKVSDDQWQQEFDEKLRQFNFKNKLGQFAPTAVSGSSSGGSSKKSETKPANREEKKRTLINAQVRKNQQRGDGQ